MKFADIRVLLRRWYIFFPGLLLAAAIAVGVWFAIPPGYSRSATQLMLPGESSIPQGGNPYLYLGGLSPAADVLVRAVGSANVLNDLAEKHPGIEVEVTRDTSTSGPIINIAVTASSEAAAEEVLTILIEETATVLDEIQDEEDIQGSSRMTVIPVTVDEQSTLEQRSRVLTTAGAGILGIVLTLLVAALVDGASLRRKERLTMSGGEPNGTDPTSPPTAENATGTAAEEAQPPLPNKPSVGTPAPKKSPRAPRPRIKL